MRHGVSTVTLALTIADLLVMAIGIALFAIPAVPAIGIVTAGVALVAW